MLLKETNFSCSCDNSSVSPKVNIPLLGDMEDDNTPYSPGDGESEDENERRKAVSIIAFLSAAQQYYFLTDLKFISFMCFVPGTGSQNI